MLCPCNNLVPLHYSHHRLSCQRCCEKHFQFFGSHIFATQHVRWEQCISVVECALAMRAFRQLTNWIKHSLHCEAAAGDHHQKSDSCFAPLFLTLSVSPFDPLIMEHFTNQLSVCRCLKYKRSNILAEMLPKGWILSQWMQPVWLGSGLFFYLLLN